MAIALNNNPGHITRLCQQLELGNARDVPSQVPGGFHHRMWQLETDRGRYAVKQLAPDTDLRNPDTRNHYDTTEAIAERFAGEGIPALHALGHYGKYLQQIDDAGYLVYPWTDACAIDKEQLSTPHALTVARLLAQMHRADIVGPQPRSLQWQIAPGDQLSALVTQARACELPGASKLEALQDDLLALCEAQQAALPVLEQHKVISHGDLDQKNVLWERDGRPVIIDWESAGFINPTYEILLEALDWGGITSRFDPELYQQIMQTYCDHGGEIQAVYVDAAFDAIGGEWLNWFMYNLGRTVYLDDVELRALGARQVDFSLGIVEQLRQRGPALREAARALASD